MPAEPQWDTAISLAELPARTRLQSCLDEVAQAGFDAVELPVSPRGPLTSETPETHCRAVAESVRAAGLSISALRLDLGDDLRTTLGAADPALRRRACDRARAALDQARWLGTDTLVLPPAIVGEPQAASPLVPYETAYAQALESLRELRFAAARHAVRVACKLAAHRFVLSPLEARLFADGCNSPWVGACFDVGDVSACGGFPQDWIRLLGRRLFGIRFSGLLERNGEAGAPPHARGAAPREIAASLRAIGYRGFVTCVAKEGDAALLKARLDAVLRP